LSQPNRLSGATLRRIEPTDPAIPTWAIPGQCAQGRSSKAAGLRVSGSCLTEPSTLAFSFQSGTSPELLSATSAGVSNLLVAEHHESAPAMQSHRFGHSAHC